MSDEELMLAAVLGNPDDDSIRLAYADLVQERDEEFAQLVRARRPCMVCHTNGFIEVPFFGPFEPGDEPSGNDRTPCRECAEKGWVPFCQHDGCRNAGRLCAIDDQPHGEPDEVEEWYCGEHAATHGYCPSCGAFWGGISSFEARGICDHCAAEMEADDDDESEWEDDYDGDGYPDEF